MATTTGLLTMTTNRPTSLSTQATAGAGALLPTGLLTGALWQEMGAGPAAVMAAAFVALAALLVLAVRKLAAA